SIEQYIRDINVVEEIFLDQTKFLTSSHSNIVKNPDTSPFRYMRDKIIKNQRVVDEAIKRLNLKVWSNDALKELLKLDLFFPKRKMKDFMKEIYFFWESGIIKKHFERSENTF
ncbi:MAG: hypothetical protein ACFFKA_13805, partial [Candidatus Thorarchaeota archaeon]